MLSDLQGLRAALAVQAHTVWLVASARKAQVLKDALVAAGHEAAAVGAIVAPAGFAVAEQMGAHTPEEVALSVLAAVVAARRRGCPAAPAVAAPAAALVEPPAPASVAPGLAPPALAAGSSCCSGKG